MIKYCDINDIKPAEYNPRKISDKQFVHLKRSLAEIGCVVPVLVNKRNNVIIAGHQRTKAMKAVGIKEVPIFEVESIGIGDEIKFNQIHNAIDYRNEKATKLISSSYDKETFQQFNPKDFKIGDTTATVVKEICKLMMKYGNVLSCVICKNKVFLGHNYIKACSLVGYKVNGFICDDSKYDLIEKYFAKDYGRYSYEDLEKKTYVQGLAQMYRSVELQAGKKQNKSSLYTSVVFPYLSKNPEVKSILDFGCGKGAYIEHLAKRYDAVGLEFYNNNGKSIDVAKGNAMIDNVQKHLKEKGLFDIVICDSVLNSVDSMEAEYAVLRCLNIFSKKYVFVSGRTINSVECVLRQQKDANIGKRFLEFLDENNFTANYRKGQWYYQHYHTRESITDSLNKCGLKIEELLWNRNSGTFQAVCVKGRELTTEEKLSAINFEFDLPLPNNKTYGRNLDILDTLGLKG